MIVVPSRCQFILLHYPTRTPPNRARPPESGGEFSPFAEITGTHADVQTSRHVLANERETEGSRLASATGELA